MQVKKYKQIAAVLLLASCSAPSDLSELRIEMEQRLAAGSASLTDSDAAPIALNGGLAPALKSAVLLNDGYIAALALERQAMSQVDVAKSAQRPQVSANANIGVVREMGLDNITTTGAAGGVNLSQLIYDGGALASTINRSSAQMLSAQAARLAAENEIALAAARAWLDLWQYSERLRLIRSRVSEMERLVQQIERMASNGLLDKAALEDAQGQIVEFRLEESQLVTEYSAAQVRFEQYFYTKPVAVNQPDEIVSSAEVKAFAQNWQEAPNLQRQAAELLAAQAAVNEAKSAFRPIVQLQAGALSPLESGEANSLTLGLAIQYSFGDGGRRVAQLATAEATVAATDARLNTAQRDLIAELQMSISKLDSIERALPLLERKRLLSQSQAETSRSQMSTGQSNLRQLVEVEIEIYRAEDQQIVMQAERQALMLAIASLAGELSGLIGLPA